MRKKNIAVLIVTHCYRYQGKLVEKGGMGFNVQGGMGFNVHLSPTYRRIDTLVEVILIVLYLKFTSATTKIEVSVSGTDGTIRFLPKLQNFFTISTKAKI